MKNCFIALFIFTLPFCKSKSSADGTKQPISDSSEPKTAIVSNIETRLTGVYKWSGTINKSIPVFMWFVTREGVIKGELTYLNTKARSPIKILGTISKSEIDIREFQTDGNITGVFSGEISNENFAGTWWGVQSDQEFSFELKASDTALNAIDTSLAAKNIAGIYTYGYNKKGASGGFSIDEISGDLFSFDISCVTPGPSHNIAMVETDTIIVSNNSFNYEVKDAPSCEFRVRFFNGFAVVDYVNEKYDCAFGLNATVEGVFLKGGKVQEVRRE